MGGKGGGYSTPPAPKKPAGQVEINGADLKRNADGTWSYGDYTGDSRNAVIAAATRGTLQERKSSDLLQRFVRAQIGRSGEGDTGGRSLAQGRTSSSSMSNYTTRATGGR